MKIDWPTNSNSNTGIITLFINSKNYTNFLSKIPIKIMDPNDNGNISEEGHSFDKSNLSEIPISNEMDMKNMAEIIKKLEAEILAMKMASNLPNQDGHSEMKKEMDEMRKEMKELKEEMAKKEIEEGKKEIERLKMVIVEKDRAFEELKENYEKLKEELAQKERKEMENNKTGNEVNLLLLQLDPTSNQKIYKIFKSVHQAVASTESISRDPIFIDAIIKLGFINCLIKAVTIQDERIQSEVMGTIFEIVIKKPAQIPALVEANGIEALLKMCTTSGSNDTAEDALYVIAFIAGVNINYRDALIARGFVPWLVESTINLNRNNFNRKGTFVSKIAWTVQNLCRHEPLPSYEVLWQLISPISALLKYNDIQCKIEACKAIVNLTSGPNIPLVLGFIPDIILFLKSREEKLIVPALEFLENFTNKVEPNILADAGKRIKQCGGFEKLTALQYESKEEIARNAYIVLKKFFPIDVEKFGTE